MRIEIGRDIIEETVRQAILNGTVHSVSALQELDLPKVSGYLAANSKSAGRIVDSTFCIPARTSPGSACRSTAFLEKINSPLTQTSKTPPVAGINFQLLMKYSISRSFKISSVKLTALAWCPQVAQYLTTMSIPPSCMVRAPFERLSTSDICSIAQRRLRRKFLVVPPPAI